MTSGNTTLSPEIFQSSRWQGMYLGKATEIIGVRSDPHYQLASGIDLGVTIKGRLVKVWKATSSEGTQGFNWADKCMSVNLVAPAPWVRNKVQPLCSGCIRRKFVKGMQAPCQDIYVLGVLLEKPDVLVTFYGRRSARKTVGKLIQGIVSHGTVDLLQDEIMLTFGSQQEKTGAAVYDSAQVSFTYIAHVPLNETIVEEVSCYSLELERKEEEEEIPF